ncbi:hypothetical protein [Actinoplanes sp. NPDC049681]|uniref:hypothetical protein n=1 Tax=Actinoplanes sp. NPDC049681 TaxID=3363905 RepID=UPI00379899AA
MVNEQARAFPLSWQPEMTDYFQAFSARNRASKAWHKIGVMALVLATCAVGAFRLGYPNFAFFGLGLAVACFPMVPLVTWLSTRSVWHRRPALHTPVHAVISLSAGITTNGPVIDMSSGQVAITAFSGPIDWPATNQVLETKRVFVVQLTGHRGKRFLLLAKRGLADPIELDALREILTGAHTTAG